MEGWRGIQRQGVLDEIKAAEMRVKVIEREIHIIEQQEQKQKSDYEKDISVINNASASQQVIILSTNIAKYKDLDRQGYFNLPKWPGSKTDKQDYCIREVLP